MGKKKSAPQTYATHITTPTGKRVFVRGRTKEELDEKIFQMRVEMRAGVDVTCDVTFAEYAKTWLLLYKKDTLRPSSYAILEASMRNHVLPFFGDFKLKDIKSQHIRLFLREIAPYSQSLQAKAFGLVKVILQSAADDGLIVRSPVRQDDRITAEPPEESDPLTDEQVQRLLTALEGTRAYTFCLIALATGMRRGEILGLMWEDIDFDNRVIHVTHNKSFAMGETDAPVTDDLKTRAARRDLPMSQQLADHLLTVREQSSSAFVLSMANGKSLSRSAFTALWSAVERRTAGEGNVKRELGDSYGGVKVLLDFPVHPHLLRHTFITKLFEAGLDVKQVQYLAGHSTPEMTMRVYTHYRAGQRADETHQKVCTALDYLSPAREAVSAS